MYANLKFVIHINLYIFLIWMG